MTDSITLVTARHRRLAKLIGRGGTIQDYDNARTINLTAVEIADLDALEALLTILLGRPDTAVVRGAIADPELTQRVRRLLHADPRTGDTPTLSDVPREWLALDLDGLERPHSLPADDLEGCAQAAIQRLPKAFQGASCIGQASASHGIKLGIRMRLWFLLSRPATGSDLTRWLRCTPTDPAVFRPAQLIYTAAPLFAEGVRDHLPRRILRLPGRAKVTVPDQATLSPPARSPAPPLVLRAGSAHRYAFAALRNSVARVATSAVGNRHATVMAEARQLARFVEADLLTASEVRSAITSAAEQAGKPRNEVTALLDWAFAHPSNAPLSMAVSR